MKLSLNAIEDVYLPNEVIAIARAVEVRAQRMVGTFPPAWTVYGKS
jgi:hypothetical protein